MPGGAGGREVGRISIRVVPNLDGFRKRVKAEIEAVENSLRGHIEFESSLDGTGARRDMSALMARLKAQAASGVTIKTKVDRSMLDRFQGLLGGMSSAGSGFGGGAGGLGRMGQFADTIAVVAAVAALAAPALALISGALVSIPAIAALALTPIAAIALGLDGIKNAASQLAPDMDKLKKRMSDTFEARLTPTFAKLPQLFDRLSESLPAVANGISDVIGSVVDVVTSAPGMQLIDNTIKNISETISKSAPGIGKFTTGMMTLAEKVTAKFPRLSENFDKAAESFLGWLDEITTADPKTGISKMDSAMESLGGTLGEALGLVKDLAKQGFDFLADPQFGQVMKDFVADVRNLANMILPGLKTGFEQIAGYIGVAVDGLSKLDQWQPPAWMNIDPQKAAEEKQGVGAFPGMKKEEKPWFDGKAGAWLDKAEVWIEDLPNKIKGLFDNENFLGDGPDFSGWWDGMKAPFVTAWDSIRTAVSTGVSTMGVQLSGIWNGVAASAQGAWNSIVSTATSVVSRIVSSLAQLPGQVASAWSAIPGVAAGVFNAVVATASSVIQGIVATFVSVGGQIVGEVGSWPGKILGALGDLGGLLVGAGQALMNGLLSGIKSGLQAVLDFASGIAAKIAAVKGPIPKDRKELTPAGLALMEGLQNGIESGTGPLLDKARSLAEEIATAIDQGLAGVDMTSLEERLDQTMDEIGVRQKEMQVEYDSIPKEDKEGRKAFQSKRDQLKEIKNMLNLQEEQLGFSKKYGEQEEKNSNVLGDNLTKMLDIGTGLGETVVSQHASDLGISGEGAISQLLSQGLGMGSQMLSGLLSKGMGSTTIQVNSVDEAVAADKSIAAKKALQYYRR